MAQITVIEKFNLTRDNGAIETFQPGTYEVPEEDATHWFVLAHCKGAPARDMIAGTPEFAAAERRRLNRRKILDAAAEENLEEREGK